MSLFEPYCTVGIFRGFEQGGMEFHADLVLPYREEFQSSPMHGQFVLVQLENEREAVFGRITTISAQGRLTSPIGEDYAVRAVLDGRPIPEDLRDQYLKYKVEIRVLGVLRREAGKLLFVPSHRRLPHVGAKVAFPGPELLLELANANDKVEGSAELGFLAFGEFVYAGTGSQQDPRAELEPWAVPKDPVIIPRFEIYKLLARRSFVFARAGFGKSNLVKLLFSSLYQGTPTVPRRGGGTAPVGTVIFDPDGEYFWPDPHGRPGLCDVEWLRDRLAIFTNRAAPSDRYQSFVVDGIKLDLRDLPAELVIGIAIAPEKQEQQNILRLKGLSRGRWRRLVDLIHHHEAGALYADPSEVQEIIAYGQGGRSDDPQINATISNMVRIVRDLHDPSSRLLPALRHALSNGKLCVVDISQMRGRQGLQLAGIILAHIFHHNQEQFTEAHPKTIPTIAVLEEAQSILGAGSQREEGPFISWVKEGRKYDLGAMLITQQPGSIPGEILSQGDNFFIFHLLAEGDLRALKKANAHFSDDLLASLLNEPLVGHGIFWSSAPGGDAHARPYPLPVRVLNFNKAHTLLDPGFKGTPIPTYASGLRAEFASAVEQARAAIGSAPAPVETYRPGGDSGPDLQEEYVSAAAAQLARDPAFLREHRTGPMPWKRIQQLLRQYAPPDKVLTESSNQWTYHHLKEVLNLLFGPDGYENPVPNFVFRPDRYLSDQLLADGGRAIQESDEPPF
jgi:hypothetical protein